MNRLSQHIAQKLIDLLPEDQEYFKLNELRQYGFPAFVIKRMQVELERNLAESIVPPKTDWANMQTEAVQNAWDRFISAIRAEARLPASYALSVVETAIDDIMGILLQPRKNLPEVIFGASDTLSYEEVLKRMDSIVVYRHFATLIPKYMEKKGLKKLDRARCSQLIEKADKKLTEHYTPLNWAQMLEPLFTLLDGQIDSNLLRLFFEDKKMPRVARSFDLMNRTLNRAQLIEVLSSPELLNVEGYEQEQSELFQDDEQVRKGLEELEKAAKADVKSKKKESPPEGETEKKESEAPVEKTARDRDKPDEPAPHAEREKDEEAEEEMEDPDSILSRFHEGRERLEPINREEEDDALNTVFEEPGQEKETDTGDKQEPADKPKKKKKKTAGKKMDDTSLNEIFSGGKDLSIENRGKERPAAPYEFFEKSEREVSPMWQRYMDHEEPDEPGLKQGEVTAKKTQKQKESEHPKEREEADEEGFIEEPIIDLTKEEGPDASDVKRLNGLLSDQRERFVEEIFRGAEEAYEEALRNIATIEQWRDASKYIEKEVFKRNLVDMYSETAVDFTDRLQTYFIGKNKSKS